MRAFNARKKPKHSVLKKPRYNKGIIKIKYYCQGDYCIPKEYVHQCINGNLYDKKLKDFSKE